MTIRYVGEGGSDSANGLSWANRKLTLNGAEDSPVGAGDTVRVGPGVYREMLTVDVAGSSGNEISYIGDPMGAYTDGIGGPVRITGSNTDKTPSRESNIFDSLRLYRFFSNFQLDGAWRDAFGGGFANYTGTFIVEDCVFAGGYGSNTGSAWNIGASGTTASVIFRRCLFMARHLYMNDNYNITLENNVLLGASSSLRMGSNYAGTALINNNTFIAVGYGINLVGTATGSITITNNLFVSCGIGIYTDNGVNITEDYNSFAACNNDIDSFSKGANSDNYPALFKMPQLAAGYPREFSPWQLSSYSPVARIAGSGETTTDFYGITKPTTNGKRSRGAVQVNDILRATTPLYGDTAESLEMPDANRQQFRIPVTATSTTISLRVYREANYAGTLPQMVIKEPGQSDRTTTDTGSVSTWNLLTDTFTPDGSAGFIVIELVSDNTATSGSYSTFWSELQVS